MIYNTIYRIYYKYHLGKLIKKKRLILSLQTIIIKIVIIIIIKNKYKYINK